ncbi:MAG: GNAT family N-acetyltransferase [Anaerolineae bacterium]|nr:GNAT family N-acetyltransferase [Anaerolineae bacterium]
MILPYVPTIEIRALTEADIEKLPSIRPTYKSNSILAVEHQGEGITRGWQLTERPLQQPFDKGTLYDFDEENQANIRERLLHPDDTYQRVADYEGLLVGLLDVEIHYWNNTLFVWNLMVDLDYRNNGIGRRLWHRARDFAKQIGVRAIMIETQNTNVAACRFYERMGCQIVGLNEALYDNAEGIEEIALFWAYLL